MSPAPSIYLFLFCFMHVVQMKIEHAAFMKCVYSLYTVSIHFPQHCL